MPVCQTFSPIAYIECPMYSDIAQDRHLSGYSCICAPERVCRSGVWRTQGSGKVRYSTWDLCGKQPEPELGAPTANMRSIQRWLRYQLFNSTCATVEFCENDSICDGKQLVVSHLCGIAMWWEIWRKKVLPKANYLWSNSAKLLNAKVLRKLSSDIPAEDLLYQKFSKTIHDGVHYINFSEKMAHTHKSIHTPFDTPLQVSAWRSTTMGIVFCFFDN